MAKVHAHEQTPQWGIHDPEKKRLNFDDRQVPKRVSTFHWS
jgi:hypothetical protein